MPLAPEARIVVQVHYHPHGGVYDPDKTSIDLQFSQAWPTKIYSTMSLGNEPAAPRLLPGDGDTQPGQAEFRVPSNVAEHTEHMRIEMPDFGRGLQIVSAIPHMHMIGTRIWTTIERANARGSDPETECLSSGGWNFDWQRTYTYDAPISRLPSIAAGDIVDMKCTYDNTLGNPFVRRLLAETDASQPFDLTLGEGATTDEMCLEFFGVVENAPRP
jgi:hypothetical protein